MAKPEELKDSDFAWASKVLGCEVELIKAFSSVESSGYGFWQFGEDDWRPRILFEAHWFHRLTNGKYDESHPNISSPVRDQSLYLRGQLEYKRLDEACALDPGAGLQSASWGRFQILGVNYSLVGYKGLRDFIDAMYRSEQDHLRAFVGFINSKPALLKAIQVKDFRLMAFYYNGESAVDTYSKKLSDAYNAFKERGV